MNSYFALSIAAILWCVVHSFLIAMPVTERFKRILAGGFRFYRILYNLLSFFLLIPVIWLEQHHKGDLLLSWDEPWLRVVNRVLILISLLIFYLGARQYHGMEFLGLAQLKSGERNNTLTRHGKISTEGILGIIRHPWYLGSLIIIWLRDIYVSVLIVNLVFSLYLIIGTILEERKLLRIFGDEYREYQKRVSMLVPWKWVKRLLPDERK
ncbi:MAG: DUF1295 domain-containing protein [Bacteroidales bacterium]|nr:DUF1295 domain-containing protein [Bacteroidales bacterium]